MKHFFEYAKFAGFSLACLVLSFLFFGAFRVSGMNHRLGNSVDKIGQFAVVSPALIAIILALASLIWNRRKTPGLIALVVAVGGTWALFALGG